MLSVTALSGGQENYYAELAREDYYTRGGEPDGTWWGRGAASLSLQGTVQKESLRYVFRGLTPDGNRTLVRNAGRDDRRAGFDLTFSAPKSVSTLWSQADSAVRAVIQEAHAASVSRALQYIEEEASFTRKGAGGSELERVGLTVAVFDHSTARGVDGGTPDPQLHSHCLVMNVCQRKDGSTGTLDGRHFFWHQMTAGGLYRTELFYQIERRLGLLAERRGKWVELEVVPQALMDEFSKRSQQIRAYLDFHGGSGARDAERAALRTRSVKPKVDRESFLAEWRRVGPEFGFEVTPELIQDALRAAPARNVNEIVAGAALEAVSRLTKEKSHFSGQEVLRLASKLVETEGVGVLPLRLAVSHLLESSPELVRVGEIRAKNHYTTREMLELERATLAGAEALSTRKHSISEDTLRQVLDERPTMKQEQRKALESITGGSALAIVRGRAGTGKTFMLDAAREAFESEGLSVIGACLSAKAAKELERGSGIQSGTIHRLLWQLEQERVGLDSKTVLVVDEAAMVGTRQMERLVSFVQDAGAKLVLVGDERQLPAIEAGAPFASMARRFGSALLQEITRQKEAWAREAVKDFSRGEAEKALASFKERGLFFVGKDKDETMERLVDDWKTRSEESDLAGTLILTGTKQEAAELNRRVQKERYDAGLLDEVAVDVGPYAIRGGDRVLFRRNSALVTNGDTGVVTRIAGRRLTAKLDGGRRVTIDVDTYTDIQLGYATTTHSAQGATLSRCFVLCGGSMQDREATYVQASRAIRETRLYTDRASAGEELADIIRQMDRSRQKDLAVDVIDAETPNLIFEID